MTGFFTLSPVPYLLPVPPAHDGTAFVFTPREWQAHWPGWDPGKQRGGS